MTIQEEIDKLLKLIEDNRKLMTIPKIFIPANSNSIDQVNFIPEDASPFEKAVMEDINTIRSLPMCSKCDPKEGGMQVLDWKTGKWNCVIHKD